MEQLKTKQIEIQFTQIICRIDCAAQQFIYTNQLTQLVNHY